VAAECRGLLLFHMEGKVLLPVTDLVQQGTHLNEWIILPRSDFLIPMGF